MNRLRQGSPSGSSLLSGIARRGAGAASPARAQAPPPPPMTNLQIFPKDTPRPQVIATMQAFTASLGVAVQLLPRAGRPRRPQRHGVGREGDEEGRARHDAARARDQHEAAGGGRQERGRDDARRLRDLPPRRADSQADHRHRHRRGSGRRRGGRAREVQGAARRSSTAARATTSARTGCCTIAQRANTANKPDDALAYLNANLEYYPKSARTYRRDRPDQERQGRQGRRDRRAREGGRARPEQRAGEGAARKLEEVRNQLRGLLGENDNPTSVRFDFTGRLSATSPTIHTSTTEKLIRVEKWVPGTRNSFSR